MTISMRSLRLLLPATAAALGCAPAHPPAAILGPVDPGVAITGATLWDGTGRSPVPDAVVLIRGNQILCAGPVRQCPIAAGARVIDASGRWLIPGLIDSHVHLLFLVGDGASEGLADDLRDLLAKGITAVRDMGTNPAELLARVGVAPAAPRVFPMQLVAGVRFFYSTEAAGGFAYRRPPAEVMQSLGWTPLKFLPGDDADSIVALAQAVGAAGLKLYADLDREQVRALVQAAHRVGMPVWGHAWVQPASGLEQALAGQDGLVHAAGLVGELFTAEQRETLLGPGALLAATARYATPAAGHDERVLAALNSMVRLGTFLEPTLDVTLRNVAHYDARNSPRPSLPEAYARAAVGFGMAVTREAVARGVRITAGTDHVAYGPPADRASLAGELLLLVDSIGLTPAAALQAATRDAALAIGGEAATRLGTIEPGRYADLVLLTADPLADIRNVEAVEWVMQGGRLLRPERLRSGIALRQD